MKVVIKYSVEVEGLPVYSETYDVDTLAKELKKDEAKAVEIWSRRIKCVATCRDRAGFSSCLTRCLSDGSVVSAGIGTVNKSEQRFRRTWAKSALVSRAGRIHSGGGTSTREYSHNTASSHMPRGR